MTVDVKLAGSSLTPAERQAWAQDATVVEDAIPASLGDTFGGVGSISVTTEVLDNTMVLQGAEIELSFSDGGTRKGTVATISNTDGVASIAGATGMSNLNRTISAKPVTTTLGDALRQYFQTCGLATSQYSIDSTIAARSMLVPGWDGNCWEKLKELGAIERFDIGDVDGVVTVGPKRAHAIDVSNAFGSTVDLSESISGRTVETFFYVYKKITNALVYPPAAYNEDFGTTSPGGWNNQVEVITATPGEPTVMDVPVMASLSSVQQPVCVTDVGPNYAGPSAYTVMMADGVQTVSPATWKQLGGKVTVEVLPDTQTIRITVDAGNNVMDGAPYRIAMSAGSSSDYSSLRIMGTGISIEKNRLRMPTSVPAWMTDNDIASSTDSIFCRTQDQARRQLRAQASAAGRSIAGLSVNIGEMPNSFGQRAGALITRPEGVYRVRTCSTGAGGSTLQADLATTNAEFNAAWAGKTNADFKAAWSGYRLRNFNTSPLMTSMPTAPVVPVLTGYGLGGYGGSPYGQ